MNRITLTLAALALASRGLLRSSRPTHPPRRRGFACGHRVPARNDNLPARHRCLAPHQHHRRPGLPQPRLPPPRPRTPHRHAARHPRSRAAHGLRANPHPRHKAIDGKGRWLLLTGPIPADLNPYGTSYGRATPRSSRSSFNRPLLMPNPPSPCKSWKASSKAPSSSSLIPSNFQSPAIKCWNTTAASRPSSATMINAATCKVADYSFDLPDKFSEEQRHAWLSQLAGLKITITDAPGSIWRQTGGSTSSGGATHVGAFRAIRRPPARLPPRPPWCHYFKIVVETKPITIPFRMEDIPLP